MEKRRKPPAWRPWAYARLFSRLAVVLALAAGLQNLSAGWARAPVAAHRSGMSIFSGCRILTQAECARIAGGDVKMRMNAARTNIHVNVIDNEYEARLGRIPPKESFDIEVHNRVMKTNRASYIPASDSRSYPGREDGLTTMPEPFPEGTWRIVRVRERTDKYGPFMIMTDAIGMVDVFRPAVAEGELELCGRFSDTAYGIHSNTIPFERSLTYGCVIARQEDLERLALVLAADRAENRNAVQLFSVDGFPDCDEIAGLAPE